MELTSEFLFGWAGAIIMLFFYLSPAISFINLIKKKITFEDTPAVIVTVSYCNCLLWEIYGDLIDSKQIKICCVTGLIFCSLYLIIYLLYEAKKYLIDSILNVLIILIGSYTVHRALNVIIYDKNIIGKICIVSNLILFLFPVQLLVRVFKEKNYTLIPITSSLAFLLSCVCWGMYGYYTEDINIIFPGIIGLTLSIIQVLVWNSFKNRYEELQSSQEAKTIGIETTPIDAEGEKKPEEQATKLDSESNEDKKIKEVPVKMAEAKVSSE